MVKILSDYNKNMIEIIETIRQQLKQNSDQKRKEGGEYFFKEKVKFYGVKTAVAGKIGKGYFRAIKKGKNEK